MCSHCKKEIRTVTIVIDKTHFVHQECEKEYREVNGLIEIDNPLDECETADCLD